MLLSTPWTSQPSLQKYSTTSEPISPDEPVTSSLFISDFYFLFSFKFFQCRLRPGQFASVFFPLTNLHVFIFAFFIFCTGSLHLPNFPLTAQNRRLPGFAHDTDSKSRSPAALPTCTIATHFTSSVG